MNASSKIQARKFTFDTEFQGEKDRPSEAARGRQKQTLTMEELDRLQAEAHAAGADDAGAEQAVADVAKMGVHTFVIGISTDSSTDAVLNQMAVNGLEPQPGSTKYYPVASQSALTTTINNIAGQIISCSFPLGMAPPNPANVGITADGNMVPHDTTHMNGWDYGPGMTSIQFYGSWCSQLQSGSVMNVQAIFACGPIS